MSDKNNFFNKYESRFQPKSNNYISDIEMNLPINSDYSLFGKKNNYSQMNQNMKGYRDNGLYQKDFKFEENLKYNQYERKSNGGYDYDSQIYPSQKIENNNIIKKEIDPYSNHINEEFKNSLNDIKMEIENLKEKSNNMENFNEKIKEFNEKIKEYQNKILLLEKDNQNTSNSLRIALDNNRTKDDNVEVCWVRIEGVTDKTFFGRLLNEPYKDSGCHEGDIIEFFIYETDEGRLVCVSEGKIVKPITSDENSLKTAIKNFNGNRTESNLIEILEILRDVLVWIPCNAVVSEADIEILRSKKVGDTFQSTDNIRMIPDILQAGDEYFFPVFTSCEEMGEYGENFSKVEKWFLEAIILAQNNEKQVKGIVINAFTDSFVVPNDLLEIVKERGSRMNEVNE